MSLTKTKTVNTVTKPTVAKDFIVKERLKFCGIYYSVITNNRVFPKNRKNNLSCSNLTSSSHKKEVVETYLTDSWQPLADKNMFILNQRSDKWFESINGCADTRKCKHTQLSKANYYDCIEN